MDFKHKVKSMLQYFIYGRFAGESYAWLLRNSQSKALAVICAAPAAVIYTTWKNSMKRPKVERWIKSLKYCSLNSALAAEC